MKEYTGSVYVGVVGPESEPGVCRDSIQRIVRREGDQGPYFIRATKGYEARQMHLDKFMAGRHDFILLLDHDMIFPTDTLERLRAHKLPYVSGLYMRRRYDPIAPIWFHDNPRGVFPMEPYVEVPERGKLHKIGASGWGVILLHREVVEATRALLKGEPDVIEDDMDLYPYDIKRIMGAIQGLDELVRSRPGTKTLFPALAHHVEVLGDEIRVLRGAKDPIGSDIRFPFFARKAGYQLWGDPDVRCSHLLNYPLTPDDFEGVDPRYLNELQQTMKKKVRTGRRDMRRLQNGLVS